jgi:hypothetical protein
MDLSAYDISATATSLVCLDIAKLAAAVDAGAILLSVEKHKTRSDSYVYWVNAKHEEKAKRLYFALPKGLQMEVFQDERPKFMIRLKNSSEHSSFDAAMGTFEEAYKGFMTSHIEKMVKESSGADCDFLLATFGKNDDNSRALLANQPKDLKSDQVTRLCEAKGSHILITISYIYVLHDEEKNRSVYGPAFEVGRFPFKLTFKKERSAGSKRKAEVEEGAEAKVAAVEVA